MTIKKITWKKEFKKLFVKKIDIRNSFVVADPKELQSWIENLLKAGDK